MSKLLVLGGAGFIGSHLSEALTKNAQSEVLVLDSLELGNNLPDSLNGTSALRFRAMDVSDPIELSFAVKDFCPDVVWHLAANSDIQVTASDPTVDLKNTFGTTFSLVSAFQSMNRHPRQIVFASTSAVYGRHESEILEESLKLPESAYGWMKLSSEYVLKQYVATVPETSLIIARFPNVTGARQTHGVVKDLVRKYFDLTKSWQVLGNGFQTKPYIHVGQLVEHLVSIASREDLPKVFEINISPKDTISVREIVRIIDEKGGLGRNPEFGNSDSGWPGDVPNYKFDTARFASLGLACYSSRLAIEKSVAEELVLYSNE
jgi:UDP-glucose 4-epimerase